MKHIIFSLMLLISLSGCVGYTYSRNGDVVIGTGSSLLVGDQPGPPNRKPDQVYPDGSEMFVVQNEREWCGLTIWAIVPIPLWLPVCHIHTEITYKNGKIIKASSQSPILSGALCGPLVWVPTGMAGKSGFGSRFCSNDWRA